MDVRRATDADAGAVAPLIAKFRAELRGYRGAAAHENIGAAREEFLEYIGAGYPVYICETAGVCAGYLVCRVEEPVVWAEALFVLREHRRAGIASRLYSEAEKLAAAYGEDTVYNYVHPNNDAMIEFLRKRGYTVLNLIELRKKHGGETTKTTLRVGDNEFDY